jgi:conjugal transfer/type IV secretion protein DotA/TraY
LVFAVGLLVPINGQLNSGQYIFLKTAEWGSGLASQTWNWFIASAQDPTANPALMAPHVEQNAKAMILNHACATDFNARLATLINDANALGATDLATDLGGQQIYISCTNTHAAFLQGQSGTKCSFEPAVASTAGDFDICGYWFIPDPPTGSASATAAAIYTAQAAAFAPNDFATAGSKILELIPPDQGSGGTYTPNGSTPVNVDQTFSDAVYGYQQKVNAAAAAAAAMTPKAVADNSAKFT